MKPKKRPSVEINKLIARHKLRPHPEGGFYRETYRSTGRIPRSALPPGYGGDRRYATAVLYLLSKGQVSRFHRLRSDETWHFHRGGPLEICEIPPRGRPRLSILGPDASKGHELQHTIPAGSWFAAKPAPGVKYSLVGCTVAPGFEFEDFELADPGALAKAFPRLSPLIGRFSRP